MTRRLVVVQGVGLALLAAGCSSLKPGNLQITLRDQEVYKDPAGTPLTLTQETQHSVAILVAQGKEPRDQAISKSLDSSLTAAISGLTYFKVVERSNLTALAKEQSLETINDDQMAKLDVGKADYLITAQISSATLAPIPLVTGSYRGKVQIDFRFYEKVAIASS